MIFFPYFCSSSLAVGFRIIAWLRSAEPLSRSIQTLAQAEPLGSLCLCSVTHTEAMSDVQRDPPVLHFVPAASGPGTGCH